MPEKPILFSAPMVNAILEGRKTQTRRILKNSTEHKAAYNPAYLDRWKDNDGWKNICPYGKIGDELWVRETCKYFKNERGNVVAYRSDYKPIDNDWAEKILPKRWTPSIHMPRWASRIQLKITNIRIERLHDITEPDALAEGFHSDAVVNTAGDDYTGSYAVDRFASLFEKLNPKAPINPWVWVVEFERVKP